VEFQESSKDRLIIKYEKVKLFNFVIWSTQHADTKIHWQLDGRKILLVFVKEGRDVKWKKTKKIKRFLKRKLEKKNLGG